MSGQIVGDRILCREAEKLDRKAQGAGKILNPIMYRLTGENDYDRLFMAEVVQLGTGLVHLGHEEVFVVEPGDVLLMNLCNVSYRIHRDGLPHWIVQNRFIAGVLNKKDFSVTPVQHWILCESDDERASKVENPGRLYVPASHSPTDHIEHGQGLHAAYGTVVACGPGRWVDGDWVIPPCEPGDFIMYDKSHSTLPVTLRGKSQVLVCASQVLMVDAPSQALRDSPAAAAQL